MVLGHYKKDKKAWGRKLVNVDALVDYHMEKIEYFRMVQFKVKLWMYTFVIYRNMG